MWQILSIQLADNVAEVIIAAVGILIAVFVLHKNSKTVANRFLAIGMIFVSVYGTSIFIYDITSWAGMRDLTLTLIFIFLRLATISILAGTICLYFAFQVVVKTEAWLEKKVHTWPILIGIAVYSLIFYLWPGAIETVSWEPPVTNKINYAMIGTVAVGIVILMLVTLRNLYQYGIKLSEGPKKKKMAIVFVGFLIVLVSVFINIASEVVPGVDLGATLVLVFFIILACGFSIIAYGTGRSELFTLSPALAAYDLYSILPDAVFLVDLQGKVQVANPAATLLTMYEKEELTAIPIVDLFIAEKIEGEKIHDILTTAEVIHYLSAKISSKMGTEVNVTVSKTPIITAKGTHVGFIYILGDLTELLRADQARLGERERVIQEFVSKFSHELRNPLNIIIGFTNILLDNQIGTLNSEQMSCLEDVNSSGNYLLSLVNEILDLAKIESGLLDLPIELFAVRDVIEMVKPQVEQMNHKANHEITYVVDDEEAGMINSCKLKLQQVLLNLLSNAIKYTRPSGHIIFTFQKTQDDAFYFAVEDNGIGIREEDKEKIFQKFTRLNTEIDGTGLGLTLSKQIIAHLGGDLQFESIFGAGSKFFFTLPRQMMGSRNTPDVQAGNQIIQ